MPHTVAKTIPIWSPLSTILLEGRKTKARQRHQQHHHHHNNNPPKSPASLPATRKPRGKRPRLGAEPSGPDRRGVPAEPPAPRPAPSAAGSAGALDRGQAAGGGGVRVGRGLIAIGNFSAFIFNRRTLPCSFLVSPLPDPGLEMSAKLSKKNRISIPGSKEVFCFVLFFLPPPPFVFWAFSLTCKYFRGAHQVLKKKRAGARVCHQRIAIPAAPFPRRGPCGGTRAPGASSGHPNEGDGPQNRASFYHTQPHGVENHVAPTSRRPKPPHGVFARGFRPRPPAFSLRPRPQLLPLT